MIRQNHAIILFSYILILLSVLNIYFVEKMLADVAVTSTNDDASHGKRSATHLGYWQDNFIQYFVKNLAQRKAPEINRGYYLRYKCVRNLIDKFLVKTGGKCQIVSVGAGFDTLYWNLQEKSNLPKFGIYEIDLKEVVEKKCFFISTRPPLRKCLLGNIEINKSKLDSEFYHLISGDLCDVSDLNEQLMLAGIQKNIPTLFLAECVLVYLPFKVVHNLLEYIATEFRTVMLVDYDPINLNDTFGEVMKQHLRGRKCTLLAVQPDLISKEHFYSMFTVVNGKLLIDAYHELPSNEKTRIEKIEFLDEIDLLFDLLKHYAITWSFNDRENVGLNSISLF